MVIVFLADGFELVEALTPVDMLKRAGKEVVTVSITSCKEVKSSCGVTVTSDITANVFNALNKDEIECVILPGGMPGAKNLRECDFVCDTVKLCANDGKIIGAICAAPFILGELGILKGRNAICFPGFEDKLTDADISEDKVVTDGNIITAKGMGIALQFSYEIIRALCGKNKADEIIKSIMA